MNILLELGLYFSLLSLLSDQTPSPGTTTSLGALPATQVLDYVWSRTGLVYRLDPAMALSP